MHRMRWVGVLGMGLVLTTGLAHAKTNVQIPAFLQDILLNDGRLRTLVEQRVKAGARNRRKLPGKSIKLGLANVYRRALSDNLGLKRDTLDEKSAAADLAIRRSVFWPTLALRLAHTQNHFRERSETITRPRETEITQSGEVTEEQFVEEADSSGAINGQLGEFGNFARLGCVTVNGRLVNPDQCTVNTVTESKREFASVRTEVAPQTLNLVLEAVQNLPWGAFFSASTQSSRRTKSFYASSSRLERFDGTVEDPVGQGTTYPWTQSFSLLFSSPLPWSKNYGRNGFGPQVNIGVAQLEHRRSKQVLESRTNALLNRVDQAYWSLLKNQAQLQIRYDLQLTVAKLAERGQKRFELRVITAYDLAQINTEYSQAKIQLELAWQDYLTASNLLVELLNLSRDHYVLVDMAVGQFVDQSSALDRQSLANTLRLHPDVIAAKLGLEQAQRLLRFQKQQQRADLSVVFSIDFSQTDQVFGYETLPDALGSLFGPDQRNYFIGLSYRLPLGKRAQKSAWTQAKFTKTQANADYRFVRNTAVANISTVTSNLASAQAIATQRQTRLGLARLAYDKAERLWQQSQVTQFERLRALQELYLSSQQHIDAMANLRREYSARRAAKGNLHRWYLQSAHKRRSPK